MSGFRTVSISELTPGSVLMAPVFDQDHKKLLHSGMRVDEAVINRLQRRGITEVQVHSTVDEVVSIDTDVLDEDDEASARIKRPVQRCGSCRSLISIRPPAPDFNATIWRCNTCEAIYFGSYEIESEVLGLTRVEGDATTPFTIRTNAEKSNVAPTIPPENAERLARLLACDDPKWAERRQHPRYSVSLPAVVLPLASDFRVVGEAVTMTTANISLGGAALLYTRFVDAPFLAIDFTAAGVARMQVVLQVLRCRATGPVYEIGGKFISRLS